MPIKGGKTNLSHILIVIVILAAIAWGGVFVAQHWPIICIDPNTRPIETKVEKSYKSLYRSIEDWKSYNDPEVKFFFSSDTQAFFSSKIEPLSKGYGGFPYEEIEKSLRINKGYWAKDKDKGCEPLRYYYDLKIRRRFSEEILPKEPIQSWYDEYDIEAVYKPDFQEWEIFEIHFPSRNRGLIPEDVLTETLRIAQKSPRFREIIDSGYEMLRVYWNPKTTKTENDTVVLVYADGGYIFEIEVDNFKEEIISEEKTKIPLPQPMK